MRASKFVRTVAAAAAGLLLLSACGGASSAEKATELRLGYFPNLTHAPAVLGVEEGLFAEELNQIGVTLAPTVFNAGPDVVTAIFGDSIDIAYIGPNPTINAYVESEGEAVRVIAGAASGGASLVVREGIEQVSDLVGKKLATPQLGNTQDVALRYWLSEQGLSADVNGGGDVSIMPQSNADGLTSFSSGSIDGAWVPEPWVSEYLKAGARVFLNEADIWPEGKFVTTNIIVRTAFLEANPEAVTAFLRGHLASVAAIEADPAAAQKSVREGISGITGATIDEATFATAWGNVTFTWDPLAATLKRSAEHAISVGLLEQAGVDRIGGVDGFTNLYDLTLLNNLLAEAGEATLAP